MFHGTPRSAAGFLLFWVVTSSIAAGQIPGVDVFPDSETDVKCDLVNAANAELVVWTDTGELVLVSTDDIFLDDSLVDVDGAVFINDEPVGSLRFAEDADGLATLWWLAANGRVMYIDGISFEVSVSDLLPADISGTECDACNGFWDVQSDCAAPEPQPPPDDPSPGGVTIFQLCGSGFGMLMMGLTLFGLVGMRAAVIRPGLSSTAPKGRRDPSRDRKGAKDVDFRPEGATDRSHGWSAAQPVEPEAPPPHPRPEGAKETSANE